MNLSVTIGCYKLLPFIELGILRWRRIVPDVPILLSDDKSDQSLAIKALADRYECDYVVSECRRGHFAADMQTFINALVFCREVDAQIAIKCSQRVIPVLPALLDPMIAAFSDPNCQICLPGQLNRKQITLPSARFYAKFGVLSDLVALRRDALEPEELLEIYRERNRNADNKKRPLSDSFAECTLGALLDTKFPRSHCILSEWTHHRHGQPKLYLRKSQSSASDYAQVGAMEGMTDVNWDLREWIQIEGRTNYKPKADVV